MSNKSNDKYVTISHRLREERNRIDKTQDDMAKKFGINIRTWGMYERGKTMPAAILSELEEEGIDVYYIITGKKLPIGLNNPEEEKVIKQYRNADNTIKFAINSIFDALKLW